MDTAKYRAWMFARQGLCGETFASAAQALAGAGWLRSVGGANPYLGIRARSGEGRQQVDSLAADLKLFELPSARGCTYVLPAEHFALGLALGSKFGSGDLPLLRRLGVEDAEIQALKEAVPEALRNGPLSPADLKSALGDRVRSLGEEGRKRGVTTTLPPVLGMLQSEARIRRKPANGRLDTQRYDYELWDPPLEPLPSEEEASTEIARLYFHWTGAATLKEFAAFSGLSQRAAQAAVQRAGVDAFAEGADLLGLPAAAAEFAAFEIPDRPSFAFIGNLDNILILRRQNSFWLAPEDGARLAPTDRGPSQLSVFSELWSHAILDRGRLVGLWEFDADQGEMAWWCWIPVTDSLREQIATAERYVREELGDARSFSLDSPASRRTRLDALRALRAEMPA